MPRHGWYSQKAAEAGNVVQLYANAHTGAPVRITWVTTTEAPPMDDPYGDFQYAGPITGYLKTCHDNG